MLQAVATITKNHTTTCRDCPFPHRFKKGDLCLRIADESRRPGESFHLCLKHALRFQKTVNAQVWSLQHLLDANAKTHILKTLSQQMKKMLLWARSMRNTQPTWWPGHAMAIENIKQELQKLTHNQQP